VSADDDDTDTNESRRFLDQLAERKHEKTFLQRVRERQEREATERPATSPAPQLASAGDGDQRYALATIERLAGEIAMATEGTRNATLNERALRAYRLADASGVDREFVTTHMTDAGRRCGLGDSEINSTLASARNGADKHGPAEIPEHKTYGDAYPPNGDAPRNRFTDGAAFILDIPANPPALWGHGHDVLWAEGESLMVAGPLGLGKTTLGGLILRAQLGIGAGTVLGFPVAPRDGKILYLAMDRPAQIARALARQFTENERAVLAERLLIWEGPPPADVAKNPSLLNYLAEQAGADTVYLDSVKDAAIGLSDDAVGAGYNRARQTLLAAGRQLAEFHHTVKRGANGGPPTAVADIYGSAWITNGTGSIILLSGDPGDPIVGFKHIRTPMSEVGPFMVLHDQAAGEMSIHHKVDLIELAKLHGADGLTATQAAAALFATSDTKHIPTTGEVEKARRKLTNLTNAGLLVCVEGDRGRGGNRSVWFAAGWGAAPQ
jgi:hypothetical protein